MATFPLSGPLTLQVADIQAYVVVSWSDPFQPGRRTGFPWGPLELRVQEPSSFAVLARRASAFLPSQREQADSGP